MPFSAKASVILLMSAFFVVFFVAKAQHLWQNTIFPQSNIMRAVLEIFSSAFSFCKIKGYC